MNEEAKKRELTERITGKALKPRFRDARLKLAAELKRPITVEAVADAVGVTRQSMTAIEAGRTFPRKDVFAKLCELYRCKPGDLVDIDWLARRAAEGRETITPRRAKENGADSVGALSNVAYAV